jgi:hypothetical protein
MCLSNGGLFVSHEAYKGLGVSPAGINIDFALHD